MDAKKDYYQILGLDSRSDKLIENSQLKDAFNRTIKQYHPDIPENRNNPASEQGARDTIEAYTVLKNPIWRYEYNKQRSASTHLDDMLWGEFTTTGFEHQYDGQTHARSSEQWGEQTKDKRPGARTRSFDKPTYEFGHSTFAEMLDDLAKDGWKDAEAFRAGYIQMKIASDSYLEKITAPIMAVGGVGAIFAGRWLGFEYGMDVFPLNQMVPDHTVELYKEPGQAAGSLAGLMSYFYVAGAAAISLVGYSLFNAVDGFMKQKRNKNKPRLT